MAANRAQRRKEDSMARSNKPAANARGVVTLDLGDRKVRLKLTLGAMADLEDEFGIENLDQLPMSAKAIISMLVRLAKAAGDEVTADELRDADLDLASVIEAIRSLAGAEAQAGNAPAPSA